MLSKLVAVIREKIFPLCIFLKIQKLFATDINKNYGHKYLDITEDLDIEDKFI